MFRSYRDTVRTPVKTSKEAAKKYYCDLCSDDHQNKVWESESDVEIHRRRVHKVELIQLMKDPKNFMCSVCLRKQANKASLLAHIKTDHLLSSRDATRVKRELFICDYCNNIFFNKLLLVAHIKSFHSLSNIEKKSATTTCPFCFKTIKIRSIWFHFLYHGIITTGTCPVCLIPFNDYQDALKHTECHPGFYYCNICSYETEKEGLFLSHTEKHKKIVNLEGKDVNMITRYFVPQKKASSWNRKIVNLFKGITLASEIQICVLCRTLCETEEQMLHHIYGDHSPMNTVEIKRHMCVCGEEFFNRVLLKHHIFVLKGEHRVSDGTDTPKIIKPASIPQESDTNDEQMDIIMRDNIDDGTFGIEVEINENVSYSITEPVEIDSNIEANAITFKSQENIPDPGTVYSKPQTTSQIIMDNQKHLDHTEQDISIQLQHEMDIQTSNPIQSQHETDIHLLDDLNNEPHSKINESQKEIHTQSNNEMDTNISDEMVIQSGSISHNMDIQLNEQSRNDYAIESLNRNSTEQMELDPGPKRMITIQSDNDIYKDQIIINANKYNLQLQNTHKEITIGSNSITIELVNNENPKSYKQTRRIYKKPSNPKKNIIILNDTLSKKFESSKQLYNEILYENHEDDECSQTESTEQYSYVLDSTQGQIQFIGEPSPDEDVYGVVELSDDPNEDDDKVIVEEPLLFS